MHNENYRKILIFSFCVIFLTYKCEKQLRAVIVTYNIYVISRTSNVNTIVKVLRESCELQEYRLRR